jgi:hypothetical protein
MVSVPPMIGLPTAPPGLSPAASLGDGAASEGGAAVAVAAVAGAAVAGAAVAGAVVAGAAVAGAAVAGALVGGAGVAALVHDTTSMPATSNATALEIGPFMCSSS